MVPPASHKVSRVSWYSGSRCAASRFGYRTFSVYGRLSQNRSSNLRLTYCSPLPRSARTTVWAPSISLAATLEIDLSFFSSGYLDVSVHRVPDINLWIQLMKTEVFSARFPHSEICGSMVICTSPQLFAAYHVFHRLLVPRHPPYALVRLTMVMNV